MKSIITTVVLGVLISACASPQTAVPPPQTTGGYGSGTYERCIAQGGTHDHCYTVATAQAGRGTLPPVQQAAAQMPVPVAEPRNIRRIPIRRSASGLYVVQVGISGDCCLSFMLDSGASDIVVSNAVWYAMMKSGVISKADTIDVVKYRTANGVVEGLRFRLPEIQIGGITYTNLIGSASVGGTSMLLGQNFLNRFRFWAIDNRTSELVLGD